MKIAIALAALLGCACNAPQDGAAGAPTTNQPAANPAPSETRMHPAMNSPSSPTTTSIPLPQDAGPGGTAAPLRETDSASPFSVEACTDAWLSRHRLNQYGDPPDTMYAGGTPLFNERTGARTDRFAFLFAKNAELRADCSPGARTRAH